MVGSSLKSTNLAHKPVKFVCSYGGRILPRYPDGKLRYYGGVTRVLSVKCSVSFAGLLMKMEELSGSPGILIRCQLPTEDLDALVSITSVEDLANLIEEYDCAAAAAEEEPRKPLKIRAFLSVPRTTKNSSPPPSSASSCSSDGSPPKSPFYYCPTHGDIPPRCPTSASRRCIRKASIPTAYPMVSRKAAGILSNRYVYQFHKGNGYGGHAYLPHNAFQWQ